MIICWIGSILVWNGWVIGLGEVEPLIDWKVFRPIVREIYNNRTERGGRPNNDEVVMVKMLVLQSWYGLSDPELERQATDRISFRKFLGFPEVIPAVQRSGLSGKDWAKQVKTRKYGKNSNNKLMIKV